MLDTSHRWTRQTLLAATVQMFEQHDVPEAQRNAEWMLETVLDCKKIHLYAYPQQHVTTAQTERLATMIARRVAREPVQYILGYASFYGLRLRVTPAVLIPRPETEEVVEAALRLLHQTPQPRVLDIGTGSGSIALSIKQERPDANVFACDISPDALAVATGNAATHNLDITVLQADALAPNFLASVPGPFDLIISNPPYVPPAEATTLAPEVHDHEPHLALFSSEDPLQFYRAITHHAQTLLHPSGYLVFETHADYGEQVGDLLAEANFAEPTLQHDMSGRARIASGRMRG